MSFICIVCRDLLSNNAPVDDGPVQGAAAALPVPRNNDIVATKCGHLYHLTCLRDWFNKQANPRQECPYCKANVRTDDYQRIFPIGDEESEDIETRLKNAKEVQKESKILKDEKVQTELVLTATAKELEDCKLTLEIIQYEFQEQSDALHSLRSERSDQQQMLETIEKSYKELIDKLEKDKSTLEKLLEESEMKLIARQLEMEQTNRTAPSDSANMIRDLTTSHEFLRNEIRALQEQLRATNKVSSPKRTMGSQTDAMPLDEDELTNTMSRLKMVDVCLKYFTEEKKQQEGSRNTYGERDPGQAPSSVPERRNNALESPMTAVPDSTQLPQRSLLARRDIHANPNSGALLTGSAPYFSRLVQPTPATSSLSSAIEHGVTRPRPAARSQIAGGHDLGRNAARPTGYDEFGILHSHDD